MKVVIFAGGLGTRISEESYLKPKPMIEIGEKPILWHLMKIFETQGFNEFIICLGYKGFLIKQYFMHYYIKFRHRRYWAQGFDPALSWQDVRCTFYRVLFHRSDRCGQSIRTG